MTRIAVTVTLFACLLGASACADSTAPAQAGGAKKAPAGASNTRYILASGETPGAGCSEIGNGYWLCDDTAEQASASAAPAGSDSSAKSEDSQN